MTRPLVSVIVPTFSRPRLLRRALRSIEQQAFTDWEIIVINDGGLDVFDVVRDYPHTLYIDSPVNRGLPAARNLGIEAAQGRYIAYLDDDDWFYPHHLQLLTTYAGELSVRWLYSDADVSTGAITQPGMSVNYSFEELHAHNITPVCCVMHEISLVDEAGKFDESLPNHEDWDLWLRMSRIAEPLHVKKTTCCVDMSRPTMSTNRQAMLDGYELVRNRYLREFAR